jgi:hypothetical protein
LWAAIGRRMPFSSNSPTGSTVARDWHISPGVARTIRQEPHGTRAVQESATDWVNVGLHKNLPSGGLRCWDAKLRAMPRTAASANADDARSAHDTVTTSWEGDGGTVPSRSRLLGDARSRVRPPACSAARCNDVARSRVAGSAFSRLALARLAGKAVSGGHRQIKPREPRRQQPDATTLRGSANFAI